MKAKLARYFTLSLLAGCAGWDRGCSSCMAENFASDWVIVQYKFNGEPINCWKLNDVSVTNEDRSDGVYWKDSSTGHLVHISGWYNRVQVEHNDFRSAAELMGVDMNRCPGGMYLQQGETRVPNDGLETE